MSLMLNALKQIEARQTCPAASVAAALPEPAVSPSAAAQVESAEPQPELSAAPPVLGSDDALVEAAVELAGNMQARALVVFTQSGNTARLVSRRRPQTPQIVFAHSLEVQRQLNLNWGIQSLLIRNRLDTEGLLRAMTGPLLKQRLVKSGDTVIVLASSPVARRSHVNFLKVQKI